MGDSTRDRLIDAAIEIIDASGEQAVKVREVAARAGVTEPSLYHFFGDRNGLIEEAQSERFRRNQMDVLGDFAAAIIECETREDFVALVRTSFAGAMSQDRADRRFARMNVIGSIQGRSGLLERVTEQQRNVLKVVGDAMRVAQRLGFIRPDVDCYALTMWTIGMAQGRTLIEMDPTLVDGDAWNRVATDALLAATGNPPEGLSDWQDARP